MRQISDELYHAIVEAEAAAKKAHNLCYADSGRHNAGPMLSMSLGRAQSILMHHVVKHASTHQDVKS